MVRRALAGSAAGAVGRLPGLTVTASEVEALRRVHGRLGDGGRYPIEWVIDVADNSLNWFIATAYEYDDAKAVLQVAIPDRDEPQWEGELPLDHRMIHLIECCDDETAALYKTIVAAWTIRISWRVEILIERAAGEEAEAAATAPEEVWVDAVASWLGQLSNMLYVEREGGFFEEVGIDENLKLGEVMRGGGGGGDDEGPGDEDSRTVGEREFDRLLRDGLVQAVGADLEPAEAVAEKPSRALRSSLDILERLAAEMGACMRDTLRMRSMASVEQAETSRLLKKHVLRGDLDAYERMTAHAEREAAVLQRRADHVEETDAFVGRCEARFWRAAASGLFFRRRYDVGDDVDVVLCRGLDSATGRIAKIHDNDTYDVDLDTSLFSNNRRAATSSAGNNNNNNNNVANEVGVQIPPEYLRPRAYKTPAPTAAVRAEVEDLWNVRETLRAELESLARDRDHIEADHRRGQQPRRSRRREDEPPGSSSSSNNNNNNNNNAEMMPLPPQRSSSPPPALPPNPPSTRGEEEEEEEEEPLGRALKIWCAVTSLAVLDETVMPAEPSTYDIVAVAVKAAAFDEMLLLSLVPEGWTCEWAEHADSIIAVLGARAAFGESNSDFHAPTRGTTALVQVYGRKVAFIGASCEGLGMEDDEENVAENAVAVAACLDDTEYGDAARDADAAFFLADLAGARFGIAEAGDGALAAEDWAGAAAHDTLLAAVRDQKVLCGWKTEPPSGPPTADLGARPRWGERVAWKALPGYEGDLHLETASRPSTSTCVAAFTLDPPVKYSAAKNTDLVLEHLRVMDLDAASGDIDTTLLRVDANGTTSTTMAVTTKGGTNSNNNNNNNNNNNKSAVEWIDEQLPCDAANEHVTLRVFAHDGATATLVGASTFSMRLVLSEVDEVLYKNGCRTGRVQARLSLVPMGGGGAAAAPGRKADNYANLTTAAARAPSYSSPEPTDSAGKASKKKSMGSTIMKSMPTFGFGRKKK